jgi:hypothetical protein
MKMNRNVGLALLLIFFGALILFGRLGMHHGGPHIMSFLFPIALLGLGWLGLRNGRTIIGLILVAIGGITLFAKLSGLIAIALAIGLIIYGISLLKKRPNVY